MLWMVKIDVVKNQIGNIKHICFLKWNEDKKINMVSSCWESKLDNFILQN